MSDSDTPDVDADKAQLLAAWDQLIADLQAARDVIDSPDQFAPPATGRRCVRPAVVVALPHSHDPSL